MQTYWELPGRQQQQHETKQQVLFGVQRKRSPQSAVGSPAVWVFGELDEMAKMGEDVGKDGIEFNMDLLLNKACYLDALEVFIKSSDFIYLFFSIWVINCISLYFSVFY